MATVNANIYEKQTWRTSSHFPTQMDISLKDFASDKSCSTSARTSVPDVPVVDPGEKQTGPNIFCVSPTNSDSILSSSSSSSRAREKRRKQFAEESSFATRAKINGRGKSGRADPDPSSPINFERLSSSGVDEISSSSSRSKNYVGDETEPSGIQNVRTREESRRTLGGSGEEKMRPSRTPVRDMRFDSESRSFTPSENTWYRERIRDRFNTVKERAVESLSRPQSRPQSRLKTLMMKQTGTRLEDLLKKEEDELNAAIKRHENVRRLWTDVCQATSEATLYEESCNFFTRTHGEEFAEKEASVAEESPSDNAAAENDAGGKILAAELLGIREDWEPCEFKRAESVDPKNVRDRERATLFCPPAKPVSLEEKMESGLAPRYVEEEGIYVGKSLRLPDKIKHKMEQRLLSSSDGKKWFGMNGEIVSGANPLAFVRMRPNAYGESEENSLVAYKPSAVVDGRNLRTDLTGKEHYVLDVDVSLVQFTHHPLFSREHVLVQRLKELLFKYRRRTEINAASRYKGRLEALRRTRDNMVADMRGSGDDQLQFRDLLRRYEEDIKEVRKMRNHQGQTDKELVAKILTTWTDVKQMRESQGYRNTDIKLLIKKKVSKDVSEEKRAWEGEIKKEAKEIYNELKRKYEEEVAAYEKSREEWNRSRGKKIGRDEAGPDGEDAGRSSEAENSRSDSEESSAEEPQPPKNPVFAEIREEVSEYFGKCFRPPGEPELEFSVGVMDDEDYSARDNKEHQRRAAVKRENVFLKLFYNGKEVCRSKSQPLSQKFNVLVAQRFAIRILEWPESLMIELHEDSGKFLKNLIVSGIFLPLPGCFATVENSDIKKHEFSGSVSVSYNHAGVGSGNDIVPYPDGSEYNNRAVRLFTSGTIAYRIGWAENRGRILSPPEKYWTNKREETNLAETSALEGPFDVAKLKDWINKSNLDPNDPQNSILFHFLQQAKDCESSEIRYFRLDPLQIEYDFCSESEITDNKRLKLLSLRDAGELEFRGVRMVPLSESHIQKDVFRIYEKRISTPKQSLEVYSSDQLDGHRNWGKKYLQQIRERVLKEYRLARQHKMFHDLVSEESVPDLGTLGLTFMKWLRPKRPLRPVRKERKRITPQNLTGQDIKIIVNVVRAFEVPVRKDVDSLSTSTCIDAFSLVNVRPFVEVTFRGIKARTTAADGANPTWNQDLHIPFYIKNGDLSQASLQSIKDNLYLHLFDEIVVDLIDDDTQRETSIHQRFEKHWLASMEIPFSTFYFNSKIEGTFKLYSPPVLLGYEREAHRRQFSGSTGQEPLLPQRDATYISLFITVQPPLNPPDPLKEKLESSETSASEKHLEGWRKEIMESFPHRKVKPLVMDISGKTVCITRFVKPLEPPNLSSDGEITPEMAARYVAMIPSAPANTIFRGLFDIWLTADHVLRLLSGGSEDHAILLCSYFLHLGLKAYVLLGSGIPHGSAAYVFVKENSSKSNEYFVWDATSGQKYNINDSFCPLKKIYCLFNNENIWANIQLEEMPRRTRFDLTKRNDWFPAFGKSFAAPTGTAQPDHLDYKATSRQAVEILQDKMEKRLRDNIMKWRKTKRTKWNRYCSGTLRKFLPKLEEAIWNTKEGQTPDHILEFQHILASHKMCGFPINMAYTEMEAVVEAVKATGVHCNESEEVEFALSAYIHPYPNDVLSVWIYVASLVRRR